MVDIGSSQSAFGPFWSRVTDISDWSLSVSTTTTIMSIPGNEMSLLEKEFFSDGAVAVIALTVVCGSHYTEDKILKQEFVFFF